jgi:hypothetical protein
VHFSVSYGFIQNEEHMTVETKSITGRRNLHFSNAQEILADAEALVATQKFRCLGNWSLGQILWHIAKVMNDSIDGTTIQWTSPPPQIPEPIKRRVLGGSMRSGFALPPDAAKELEPPPTPTREGLELLRAAVGRQTTETKRQPNPFFGPLTLEEWHQLHCRHAELHLSFVVPSEGAGAHG